jgi:pilus assembly protein CpaB
MLTLAVASGLVTAVGIYQRLMTPRMTSMARTKQSVPVVVARMPLARGIVLTDSHLETIMMLRAQTPSGTFTDPQSLIGRLVKEPIAQRGPILETSLAPVGHRPLHLAKGYRAVGVSVDARGGIQRFLESGDHVDVVVTMDDEEGVTSSRVILQDIEVLAVPERSDPNMREGGSNEQVPVTLAVTPPDAEALSLAMHIGTIQLLFRGYADEQVAQTSGVTRDTLLPRVAASMAVNPMTYRVVEVIRGQDRVRQRFREGSAVGPERAGERSFSKRMSPADEAGR